MMKRDSRDVARELIGTPYKELGRAVGRDGGIDCLGVVLHWFREVHGLDIDDPASQSPRALVEEAYSDRWFKIDQPKPDCVVDFNTQDGCHHLGAWTSVGVLISGSESLGGVIVVRQDRFKETVNGFYRPKGYAE